MVLIQIALYHRLVSDIIKDIYALKRLMHYRDKILEIILL